MRVIRNKKDKLVLTLEVGTTSCKATIFDLMGNELESRFQEYPTYYPRTNWAEQDPNDWWKAVVLTTRSLSRRKSVQIISLTGHMHSAVPVDEKGRALHRCLILTDRRSIRQCDQIAKEIPVSKIHSITGNRLDPYITAPKLMWLRENYPKVFEKTYKFLPPKDFVRQKLISVFATDHVDASGTMLYDIRSKKWSDEMLRVCRIPYDKLPDIRDYTEIIGAVSSEVAKLTGLPSGTQVIVGGGDDIDIVGVGALMLGQAAIHMGTTGEFAVCVNKPIQDETCRVECYPHVLEGIWAVGGPTSAAGSSLRWLRDNFAEEERDQAAKLGTSPYKLMDQEAELIKPGSDGLIFLPYLTGERCPIWNPDARGNIFGLTMYHRKAHVIRAVMEGVAFSIRNVMKVAEELGASIKDIRISGKGARSILWRQIMADVLGKRIIFMNVEAAASLGSMMLAAVALGAYKNIRGACRDILKIRHVSQPRSRIHKSYNRFYQIFKRLYIDLSEDFKALSEISKKDSARVAC